MATLQTNGKGKAGAPPPSGTQAASAPKGKAKATTAVIIPEIKSKAISKDVGIAFVKVMAKADQDITLGEQMASKGKQVKAAAMSDLTLHILKAAKIDNSIDLTAAISEDTKTVGKLNDQLRIAIGISEVTTITGKDGQSIKRVQLTPQAQVFFPTPGELKDTPEWRAKETVRQNFATALKQAAGAALSIFEQNMTATIDKAAGGVLRISGPAVKKQYGAESVLVNEKQKQHVTDKKGKVTGEAELKIKPSFGGLKRAAQIAHGAIEAPKVSNDRTLKAMTPDEAVKQVALKLIELLPKVKDKMTDGTHKVLDSLYSALEQVI